MNQPLAYVNPQAKVANNVVIEPFVNIEKNVVIEENTWIGSNVTIMEGARIGKNCRIFPGAVISAIPQDLKFAGEETLVKIGDNTTIREFVTINRGTKASHETIVGKNCLLMAYVHIAHDCIIGNNVILANAATLAGHIKINDWAIIGGLAAIHQFVIIGKYAFIGGKSGLKKDVPPFTRGEGFPYHIVGLNTVGLSRKGFSYEQIAAIKKVYKIFYNSGLNTSQALQKVSEISELTDEQKLFVDFIKNSERGINK